MANELPHRQIENRRPTNSASAESLNPTQRALAFKTFGVMDTGKQDKRSLAGAVVIFSSVLTLFILISLTAKKVVQVARMTNLTAPVPTHHEEPPKPKPPVKLPKPPVVKVEPPKPMINPPVVEVPEPPKVQPPVIKPAPTPVATPAPPKAVTPPPAPKPVAIQIAQAASVPNNSAHPSAIRLGSMSNPINNTAGPAVSPVNLGQSGAPGMNAANTGFGNPSKIAISGSGSPNGTNLAGRDNSAHVIKGLGSGIPGGTGPMNGKSAGAIQIASNTAPPPIRTAAAQPVAAAKTAPKVLFKPRPEYTDDAKSNHIEGTVYVKIHVTTAGAVQVVGVSSGLGHGLDQSALRVAEGMRFQPATQDGHPVDWDGVVNITFQLAG